MSVRVLSPHNCANKWPQVASGHYPKIIVRALLADNVLTTNNSCDNVLSDTDRFSGIRQIVCLILCQIK